MRTLASSRPRPLRFETLEARQLLDAGISAVVENGVLTVTGSDASETIHVWRSAGQYRVDGVQSTFDGSDVRSIVVDCGDGDDLVRLGVESLKGQQPLNRTVTVNSGQGNDTVQWARQTVYIAGEGHTLVVDPQGRAALNGKLPDWFDTHLADAALRAMAKDDFVQQSKLDRDAMLGIFNLVETDGTVTASEYAGLTAIVQHAPLFRNVAYVQCLSGKVVLSNPANQHYQGQPLGNLAVDSTAEHLGKLVGKWFLGTDRPVAQSSKGVTYVYAEAAGPLFASAPKYADVRQGGLGDCYLLAAAAEVAWRNPSLLSNTFIVNGDKTYTVRFYNQGRADYVTVDSQLPVDSNGEYVFANVDRAIADRTCPTWVALLEKAYVQLNEEGWSRRGEAGSGRNVYQAIANGYAERAMMQLTGCRSESTIDTGRRNGFQQFVAAVAAGRYVCVSSRKAPPNPLIVGNHAYSLVGYNRATKQVTLFNPWGIDNGTSKPGLVRFTWAQIRRNFTSVDYVC